MKNLFVLIFVNLLMIFNSATGQIKSNSDIKKFERAILLEENYKWSEANVLWRELVKDYPNNRNLHFRIGLNCFNSKDFVHAENHLQIATQKKITKNYSQNDWLEAGVPIEAIYYLGLAQRNLMDFENSTISLSYFMEKASKNHFMKEDAKKLILQNKRAGDFEKQEKNLPTCLAINSIYADYCPIIDEKGTMYFSSRRLRSDSSNVLNYCEKERNFDNDIYVSLVTENGYTNSELSNLSSQNNDAVTYLDKNQLIIYRDSMGNGQLYSIENFLHGEPNLIGFNTQINSQDWETHGVLSPDGNEFYFVSDRIGKNRDLFICRKMSNGKWDAPTNLGLIINTNGEEDSPFISPDGKKLFFSSTGHNSIGGFDVFYTEKDNSGNWTEPRNMGPSVNSIFDETFYFVNPDEKIAFFSSNRPSKYGDFDIYSLNLNGKAESKIYFLNAIFLTADKKTTTDNLRLQVKNTISGSLQTFLVNTSEPAFRVPIEVYNSANYLIECFLDTAVIFSESLKLSSIEDNFSEIYREIVVPSRSSDIREISFDPDKPIQTNYDELKGFAEYSHYFVFGSAEFNIGEKDFTEFVGSVEKLIAKKGKVSILIEASASNVPSLRLTNDEIAARRSENAVNVITKELIKRGYLENEDFAFLKSINLVQGKKYENDAMKNRTEYEKYQYIKVKVQ